MRKYTKKIFWMTEKRLNLTALICCLFIYGITLSLFAPLLSLILETRGVSSAMIGAIAMAAPAGFMIGSLLVPWFMSNFDSRTLLLSGVTFEIFLILALMNTKSTIIWFVLRFLGGLVGSIFFVVSETWIIGITPHTFHGRVMGFYNTSMALSFALGPLILSIIGAQGKLPFLFGISLMVFAGLPLLWIGRYIANSTKHTKFGIMNFAHVAPLLLLACFVVAFKEHASISLMPVYALRIGMSANYAALLLFIGAAGAALLQIPIGWLADYLNPRIVLVICSLGGLAGTMIWPFITSYQYLLWITLFLWWGFFAGVYTLAMILAGKWFKGSDLATAMASFGVFWGIGGFFGPMVGGLSMDLWDPHGLPLTLVIVTGIFTLFSIFSYFFSLKMKE